VLIMEVCRNMNVAKISWVAVLASTCIAYASWAAGSTCSGAGCEITLTQSTAPATTQRATLPCADPPCPDHGTQDMMPGNKGNETVPHDKTCGDPICPDNPPQLIPPSQDQTAPPNG
jgi:hypothetical protein